MSSKTATVETLTAEVRVLMVGSRQVTMSVYNQLDYVAPEQIEPFGRVHPKEWNLDWVHVVGRDRDGTLCRSHRIARSTQKNLETGRLERVPDPDAAEWSALPLIVLAGLR